MHNSELELINKYIHVRSEQKKYFKEKRLYGNSTQQLDLCKQLEKELDEYCNKRKKELESKQQNLFT